MYNGFLGNNGDIINNYKYYRVTLPFSVVMALSVYFLNSLFYYDLDMGTDGLALATLIVIFTANTGKILFVKSKFSMTPFTNKSFIMILIIALMYLGFNFWDFNVPEVYLFKFPIHPIINIALKSIIIALLYFYIIIKFNISNDITRLYNRFTKSNQ
jgi:hypothetical protein